MTETRALPSSEELERAVLACVLLSPDQWDTAAGLISSPEAFHFERGVILARTKGVDHGADYDTDPVR